jgi:zinc transport system substrate-binding protein
MKSKIFALLFFLLFFSGCADNNEESNGRINVLVSILPQKEFVNAVGGEQVIVSALIPPGASPVTYEPKPSDLVNIETADVYFRIGHIPFEKSHAEKFSDLNPKMVVADTSANAVLRYFGEEHEHELEQEYEHPEILDEHEHEGIDPHIWLSPVEVKKQVDIIASTLSQIDPENSAKYFQNAEKYNAKLDELNQELKTELAGLKTDKLMVFHPSWGYFADAYGLEQIAVETDGKEPSPEKLGNLIDTAKQEEIKVIFVQSQFNQSIAESIAQEIGAVIININPLAEDYINNLKKVSAVISENLNK